MPSVRDASDNQEKLVIKYQTNLTGRLWNQLATVLIDEVPVSLLAVRSMKLEASTYILI